MTNTKYRCFVSVIHGLGIRRYARETQKAGITQFIERRPIELPSNYSYCALVKFTVCIILCIHFNLIGSAYMKPSAHPA